MATKDFAKNIIDRPMIYKIKKEDTMKSFDEQNAELIEFDKSFNPEDYKSCVDRAMLLIKNREAQMTEESYEWPIATETCRWRIEQVIINRPVGMGMMAAAIEYVESIEKRAEDFNGMTPSSEYCDDCL